MSKKAVLITGGAKRVGKALALHFAAQGYDIALHYNRSKKDAQALKADIEKQGVRCELFALDLADIKAIPAFMKAVRKSMPHCNALINNASVFERSALMETSEALFDRQLGINFKAPFFLTQAFAKAFGKGAVVNMIDSEIEHTYGSHFAYMLSKKALADFTEMAARELGPHIRVNGVCPGIILPSNELDEKYMRQLAKKLPLGKIAVLEQVAEAVHWLCKSKAVTGQMMYVDGGQHVL